MKLPRGVRIDLKVFDAVVCVFVDLIEADLFGIGSGRKQSDRTSNKGKVQKPFQLARGAVEILQHNRTRLHEDCFGVTGEVGLYWWWSGWLQLAVELVCSCVEGDIAWRDQTATANLMPFVPGNVTDQVNATNKQGWLATVRPRAGVAWGNALLYVTSGAASSNRPGNADAVVVPSV